MQDRKLLNPETSVSFADVAHQTLIFSRAKPSSSLALALLDTPWGQRLRHVRQTGNTHLVYMYAEHSRFGHSLGVAYLASLLMDNLAKYSPELVKPYQEAVTAAALLHDVGHVAPGSHVAARNWPVSNETKQAAALDQHEVISSRVVMEDPEINGILRSYSAELPELVAKILSEDSSIPSWTSAIVSGGGWNADRGNWTIVDSAMCSVSYGRYNVRALIDAFRLTEDGELVILENRLDALTHFFLARDSMYRQVYQHRVSQAADALTASIIKRLRDLYNHETAQHKDPFSFFSSKEIFCDNTLQTLLASKNYAAELSLEDIFCMTESWWNYHLSRWCDSGDAILQDLASRLRDRRLLKTVRLNKQDGSELSTENAALMEQALTLAKELGYDPRYYVAVVNSSHDHRRTSEELPRVALDTGGLHAIREVEPLIETLLARPDSARRWLAVPQEIKQQLGRLR